MISKLDHLFSIIFVVPVFICIVNSEILKVQNTTHIYCIDDDDSPIFTLPPLDKIQQNTDLHKDVEWCNDDWTVKRSTDLPIISVTDKRWEDFPLVKTDYLHFNLSNSRTVSVLSPAVIEIFAYNDDDGIYKEVELNETNKWYHFSVISKNKRLLVYKNNEVIENILNTGASYITFKSAISKYWKIHKYNFKWSNTETNDNPSVIKTSATSNSCLFLYTLLCNECYLEVSVNNKTKTIYSNNDKASEIQHWQTNRIELEPHRTNTIVIYRKKSGNSSGYWAMDLKLSTSNDIVSYRKPSESCNYTCHSLHHHYQRNMKNSTRSKLCEGGKFVSECQFSCDEIFEQKVSDCNDELCNNTTSCGSEKEDQQFINKGIIYILIVALANFIFVCMCIVRKIWLKKFWAQGIKSNQSERSQNQEAVELNILNDTDAPV